MGLSFDDIKKTRELLALDVPSWEGSVTIRKLPAPVVMEFLRMQEGFAKDDSGMIKDAVESWQAGLFLIQESVLDDDGKKLFADEASQEFLQGEDIETVRMLVDAIMRHNKLGDVSDAVDSAKKN